MQNAVYFGLLQGTVLRPYSARAFAVKVSNMRDNRAPQKKLQS
jgi:hypothetical protein